MEISFVFTLGLILAILSSNRFKNLEDNAGFFRFKNLEDNAGFFSNGAAHAGKGPVEPIKLYYLPGCPACRAVMMIANILGIELDLKFLNLLEGEQLTKYYLKINPQHTIPTIDDHGFIIAESRAIMGYLVSKYSKKDTLYPKDPRARALVDRMLNFDLGTLFTRHFALYLPMALTGASYDEKKAKILEEAIRCFNAMIEGRVFVAGDNLTIADISIVTVFTDLTAFGYNFTSHTNIVNWFERTKKSLEPYGYSDIDESGAEMLAAMME